MIRWDTCKEKEPTSFERLIANGLRKKHECGLWPRGTAARAVEKIQAKLEMDWWLGEKDVMVQRGLQLELKDLDGPGRRAAGHAGARWVFKEAFHSAWGSGELANLEARLKAWDTQLAVHFCNYVKKDGNGLATVVCGQPFEGLPVPGCSHCSWAVWQIGRFSALKGYP